MRKAKNLILVAVVCAIILCLAGCNKQLADTQFTYNYAVVSLPNGEVVEGKVQSWNDFTDGDQIQVKIGGNVYLVHSSNIALIYKP